MKNKIVYIIAWLGYWFGIDRLFYCLNRRCKRVLTFHNVFPDGMTFVNDGGEMAIGASSFRRILEEISEVYEFSLDLCDVSTATVSFDDGFLNQYVVAAEVLREMDIPALLFVVGENIDREDVLKSPSVDLLTLWLSRVPLEKINSHSRIRYWVDTLRPRYANDSRRYGRGVVEECDKIWPFSELLEILDPEFLRLRLGGITMQQLDDLRGRGWRIGWHSKHHYPMSAIPEEMKREEFSAPKTMLREPMSYPYGEPKSVGIEDVALAARAGFPCAYSNMDEESDMLGQFFLPRFSVSCNKYLLHFHLSGLRHFLKTGRLLPAILPGKG